jgi:alkanesulfonate monooxygenase SsuD/methylene tetrahydromethanopterin reductase-like flavin-dependent oxidoreductase (luciferase family)
VIGGSGKQVTLPLVAKYADEWNSGGRSPEDFAEVNAYLDELVEKAGRPKNAVRRSMMLFLRTGRDQADLDRRLAAKPVPDIFRRSGVVATHAELEQRLNALEAAGLDRVILNWFDDYDDVDGMAELGRAVLT